MNLKKLLKIAIAFVILLLVIIVLADWAVSRLSKKYLYDSTEQIPANRVAMVLGTSKKLQSGQNNLYFVYRIKAAADLYHAGKATIFVVSGDNSQKDYNESQDMKDDLVKAGVPADSIFLDNAGLRTLDSVIRMKEIFGQNKFTIVSQKFHNERAITLARHYDIEAVGYNAQDVTAYYGFKTMLREKLARVKMFIDLILNKQPKFLGEKIKLP
ncbi:vancomycin high temperature exclusion protein [Apibacter muscae]|uniref:Vancomycin high temperature exclusion protein n=1 Tax=Apibacter muscae TaxID=2509004 RepID=A0A563DAS0_9FLAO|nr:ElyC/SanA/YdcF family protein [Apibacter muscae]TWP27310.1 vancomycin high temperature exclusion protein [Apibacter muscae]TWP28531.1 vancomycin high temperature exclusion protein [Apibacter muscae]